MGDVMKMLELKLRNARLQRNDKDRLVLPAVRPHAVIAASRRSRGAHAWAQNHRIAASGLPSLPPLPPLRVHEMTHGIKNVYLATGQREFVPTPREEEPVWYKPTVREGRRVDKQAWFAHE